MDAKCPFTALAVWFILKRKKEVGRFDHAVNKSSLYMNLFCTTPKLIPETGNCFIVGKYWVFGNDNKYSSCTYYSVQIFLHYSNKNEPVLRALPHNEIGRFLPRSITNRRSHEIRSYVPFPEIFTFFDFLVPKPSLHWKQPKFPLKNQKWAPQWHLNMHCMWFHEIFCHANIVCA